MLFAGHHVRCRLIGKVAAREDVFWKTDTERRTVLNDPSFAHIGKEDLQDFASPRAKRLALFLELAFLSQQLAVEHLFAGLKEESPVRGSKEMSPKLLRKYLHRTLDVGFILGCCPRSASRAEPPEAPGKAKSKQD